MIAIKESDDFFFRFQSQSIFSGIGDWQTGGDLTRFK
jgi:hypothetical protein